MSGAQSTAPNPTRRVVLKIDDAELDTWTEVKIDRALHEICGSFELSYIDTGREANTYADMFDVPTFQMLETGMSVEILIDGQTVLRGWIEKLRLKQSATELTARVSGRDICGDLVDCAAVPTGPADYSKISLQQFATQLCAPFDIGVQVQTDTGAVFGKLAVKPHEKVLPAIDKASRQRSVLVVSDGVANLLLTTAGSTRAPASIVVGDNVIGSDYEEDATKRFSDVYVKGQTAHANGNHGVPALYTPEIEPGGTPPGASATQAERAGIVMTGHAQDTEITRYRPDVRMVPTQSGSSTVQQLAEWYVRVDRGQSVRCCYEVLDWRAGPNLALWLPNTLAAVYDPYPGFDEDLLIAGVCYRYDEKGARTELTVVPPTAYERVNQPVRQLKRKKLRAAQ